MRTGADEVSGTSSTRAGFPAFGHLTHFVGENSQTLNELPQPQDELALGFLIWNEAPTISVT